MILEMTKEETLDLIVCAWQRAQSFHNSADTALETSESFAKILRENGERYEALVKKLTAAVNGNK